MKMRELERLSGVGRETIRYYIGLGLLPEPRRPKRNVADYGDEHVERLATIRRLQAESYLPLSFIKTLLERPSHGAVAPIPGFARRLGPKLGFDPDAPLRPVAEAAAATDLPMEELNSLIAGGVVFAVQTDDGGRALGPIDLAVARCWSRVRSAGFSPEAGFYAEDARLYAETLGPMVRREVDRFFTRVPGGRTDEAAVALALSGVEEINALIAAMRVNYILRLVAELAAPD